MDGAYQVLVGNSSANIASSDVVTVRVPPGLQVRMVPVQKTELTEREWDVLYSYDNLNQLTSFQRGTLNSTKDGLDGNPTRSQNWNLDGLGNSTSTACLPISRSIRRNGTPSQSSPGGNSGAGSSSPSGGRTRQGSHRAADLPQFRRTLSDTEGYSDQSLLS